MFCVNCGKAYEPVSTFCVHCGYPLPFDIGSNEKESPRDSSRQAIFVPDSWRANAYRVLRLSADATLSEIHKAAGNVRRAISLGVASTTASDIPQLGETPRAEADIRATIGRLENPTERLKNRLFWLHVPSEPASAKQPDAIRNHDEALRGLFAAFEGGFGHFGLAVWIQSLRAWHRAVSQDDYWAHISRIEEQGAFEPVAFPSEIEELRDEAVILAAEPLLVEGRAALARDDTSTVRRVLVALEELADTGPWAASAGHDIASPAIERFRILCHRIQDEFGSKIVREKDAGKVNRSVCEAELGRFRSEIEPALNGVLQFVPPNQEAAQQVREEAALCLSAIATDFTWADDFITSEQLHEEALKLAHNTLGTIRIEHGLEQIRRSAQHQRVFGASISSAPPLGSINGFGFTIYGSSDHDAESNSYATTHYFIALFLPIVPLGRYRVINLGGNKYSFLGKLPLRKVDRWHLGLALITIVSLIVISMTTSGSTGVASSYSSPTSSTENTSISQSSQLSTLKARIDNGRSQIAILKTQLQPVMDELAGLTAQMETLEAELKSLDNQQKAGVQIDIDGYNAKVKIHNQLLAKHRALMDANSTDLKTYSDLEDQDSDLVKQYNALLK